MREVDEEKRVQEEQEKKQAQPAKPKKQLKSSRPSIIPGKAKAALGGLSIRRRGDTVSGGS